MKRFIISAIVTAIALCTLSMTVAGEMVTETADAIKVTISEPSSGDVQVGDSVEYVVTYSGNIDKIDLNSGDISTVGFTADISVSGSENERVIELTNIQGSAGEKYITIGTSAWSEYILSNSEVSPVFILSDGDSSDTGVAEAEYINPYFGGGQHGINPNEDNIWFNYSTLYDGGEGGIDQTNIRFRLYSDDAESIEKLNNSEYKIIDQYGNVAKLLDAGNDYWIYIIELKSSDGKVEYSDVPVLDIIFETDSKPADTGIADASIAIAIFIVSTGAIVMTRKLKK